VRRYDFHAHDQGMSGDGCWGRHYGITGALYGDGRWASASAGTGCGSGCWDQTVRVYEAGCWRLLQWQEWSRPGPGRWAT